LEHHFTRLDDIKSGAYALISENHRTDTAVIFVHGFLGDTEGTWLNFQEMIDSYQTQYPRWMGCDVFFFPYHSVLDSISDSAESLLTFTETIFPQPPRSLFTIPVVLRHLARILALSLTKHTYKSLVFVGHSEGAIVIRRAICIAYKRTGGKHRALKAKLALFAPAHLGFIATGWIGACLAVGRIAAIAMPILSSSPAFVEMKDKDLPRQVQKDTSSFLRRSPRLPALRARTVFGMNDHVVVRAEYTDDFPEEPEPNQDHVSICKPRTSYERPLEFALK
jgi:hypothetical protein